MYVMIPFGTWGSAIAMGAAAVFFIVCIFTTEKKRPQRANRSSEARRSDGCRPQALLPVEHFCRAAARFPCGCRTRVLCGTMVP